MKVIQANETNTTPLLRDWPVIERPALVEGKLHCPAIGLLELSTEVMTHAEMRAFLPDCNHGMYTSRVKFSDTVNLVGLSEMETHLNAAADLLPSAEWLDAIVFGCTSGSMVIGPARVQSMISQARPGVPVFDPISAVIDGLTAMNLRRVAIVTPYPQETNRLVGSFLKQHGIDIVSAITFNLLSGCAMSRLSPEDLYSAALHANTNDAEAIFISCTALQVSPFLEDLEHKTQKPVVSSNQALAWQCCEQAGVRRTDGRGGALFGYRSNTPRDPLQ